MRTLYILVFILISPSLQAKELPMDSFYKRNPCSGAVGSWYVNPDTTSGGFVAETATVDNTVIIEIGASVCERAKVLNNSNVLGEAIVKGRAIVNNGATINGNAVVYGRSDVDGNGIVIDGNTKVFGNAKINDSVKLSDDVQVFGNAEVSGTSSVLDEVIVAGNTKIFGDANLFHKSILKGRTQIQGNAFVCDEKDLSDIKLIDSGNEYCSPFEMTTNFPRYAISEQKLEVFLKFEDIIGTSPISSFLIEGPEGATFEDGKLEWTPENGETTEHTVKFQFTNGQITKDFEVILKVPKKTNILKTTVPATGGEVIYSNPDSPLNGLKIIIPDQSSIEKGDIDLSLNLLEAGDSLFGKKLLPSFNVEVKDVVDIEIELPIFEQSEKLVGIETNINTIDENYLYTFLVAQPSSLKEMKRKSKVKVPGYSKGVIIVLEPKIIEQEQSKWFILETKKTKNKYQNEVIKTMRENFSTLEQLFPNINKHGIIAIILQSKRGSFVNAEVPNNVNLRTIDALLPGISNLKPFQRAIDTVLVHELVHIAQFANFIDDTTDLTSMFSKNSTFIESTADVATLEILRASKLRFSLPEFRFPRAFASNPTFETTSYLSNGMVKYSDKKNKYRWYPYLRYLEGVLLNANGTPFRVISLINDLKPLDFNNGLVSKLGKVIEDEFNGEGFQEQLLDFMFYWLHSDIKTSKSKIENILEFRNLFATIVTTFDAKEEFLLLKGAACIEPLKNNIKKPDLCLNKASGFSREIDLSEISEGREVRIQNLEPEDGLYSGKSYFCDDKSTKFLACDTKVFDSSTKNLLIGKTEKRKKYLYIDITSKSLVEDLPLFARINIAPVANLNINEEESGVFKLDASTSSDPNGSGDIVTYIFDTGESIIEQTSSILSYSYKKTGEKEIKVTIFDSAGNYSVSKVQTKEVTKLEVPEVTWDVNRTETLEGEIVTLTANLSQPSLTEIIVPIEITGQATAIGNEKDFITNLATPSVVFSTSSLIFPIGQTQASFTVTILVNSTSTEGPESIDFTFAESVDDSYKLGSNPRGTVLIGISNVGFGEDCTNLYHDPPFNTIVRTIVCTYSPPQNGRALSSRWFWATTTGALKTLQYRDSLDNVIDFFNSYHDNGQISHLHPQNGEYETFAFDGVKTGTSSVINFINNGPSTSCGHDPHVLISKCEWVNGSVTSCEDIPFPPPPCPF